MADNYDSGASVFGGSRFIPEGLSRLHFYSYGIVAKNKELSSDLIEVVPSEDQTFLDGELTDNIEKIEAEGEDHNDEKFKTTVETTNSIKAKWLSFTDTNRMTSPDVRRGEEVVIWRFGDTDQYWWCTLQQDKKLRRLETVIYGFSNVREENVEMKHDNMYWFEISTHRKNVRFHTSKNDDEPFAWDIQLNTKDGTFTIEDNDDGYFFYDAKKRHFKMHNKDKSYIEIDKKKAKIFTLDRVEIETKHFEVKAQSTIKMTTKDYSLTTQSYKVNSNKWQTTTPSANFSQSLRSGSNVYWGGVSYAADHVPG